MGCMSGPGHGPRASHFCEGGRVLSGWDFGCGFAFLPLAFVLVLVVLVVLVAVLMALWIASPVGHLELLQRTPCTGHGAPGIFADERRAGDARIPASFLPDPPPSSTRPPKDRHP